MDVKAVAQKNRKKLEAIVIISIVFIGVLLDVFTGSSPAAITDSTSEVTIEVSETVVVSGTISITDTPSPTISFPKPPTTIPTFTPVETPENKPENLEVNVFITINIYIEKSDPAIKITPTVTPMPTETQTSLIDENS